MPWLIQSNLEIFRLSNKSSMQFARTCGEYPDIKGEWPKPGLSNLMISKPSFFAASAIAFEWLLDPKDE